MLLNEHNHYWDVDRQINDQVNCSTLGYGELSAYDPDCHACYLGHRHTWEIHDRYIKESRKLKYGQDLIIPNIIENTQTFWDRVAEISNISSDNFLDMCSETPDIDKLVVIVTARCWSKEPIMKDMGQWEIYDDGLVYRLYHNRCIVNGFCIRSLMSQCDYHGYGFPVMAYYDKLTGFEAGSWKTRFNK